MSDKSKYRKDPEALAESAVLVGREDRRAGLGVDALKRALLDKLVYVQARFPQVATRHDCFVALAQAVRDRLLQRWVQTARTYRDRGSRTVCYLSAEFLIGPQLGNNLINLNIFDNTRQAMEELGLDLEMLLEQEEEPGLGNGGLGRLAACYLDSLATLEIPAIGYGIRYEFGIFTQAIRDGRQVELTDKWLRSGSPWLIHRPSIAFEVKLGGHTEHQYEAAAGRRLRVQWVPAKVVRGTAWDMPILGYGVNTPNRLRLWSAEAPDSFDFEAFNAGNYDQAVDAQIRSETITKVLYPNDETEAGQELRLEQQYFFVSCSLQDMIRLQLQRENNLEHFDEKFVVQLNDTHPSIAVAELMRLLVDEYAMGWDQAWAITRRTFAYTNHTLLPEALEKWRLDLFRRVLPRHYEIICEINVRFLEQVRIRFPYDDARLRRMSLIDEDGARYVRMAHLAVVGSFAVNGVAALHTELLKSDVLKDFHELWPEKFSNKTNGVTPRRFVLLSNPAMSRLIDEAIGPGWVTDMGRLRQLEAHADDPAFQEAWRRVKRGNKERLVVEIARHAHIDVDPASMFDIQVKRIHEYKRQHLNLLHVVSLYKRLKDDPGLDLSPRTVVFGGKAAPGYEMAKMMIRLINAVADVIGRDPAMDGRLRVVFYPNYNVKNGQVIFPAADLSEQISLAGKEASGTGNMKFQMNGALTIGTLDGANVEIREQVGEENFFLFGMNTAEVADLRQRGYEPYAFYEGNAHLKEVIDLIGSGFFTRGDRDLFRPLLDNLLYRDEYMLLADFQSYIDCQQRVSDTYRDVDRWSRMSILNVARSGFFSSDRAIRQYCEEIWKVQPVRIELRDLSREDLVFRRATAGAE
ncbi:glycogen/starch/alpha-glucan phosphorylase [Accumulibacter sp.]|uniref:glycogen/starch/alpha-glucan phosphorylase n=1 Tax=Accumulibacter sp. TaxID=2053492 RepID=UPI0025D76B40|nr:glycogen/starch/alpha-glucan phosphorylase [Accumulibacter sp.]MCM8594918.1 glycogen/starch/alpha-glucan phosphorylase [Accumulibacter sp.]MCM8627129.1 glycogen/starch/alpha-glucan phosphorylase [Accumulibacter sp.]MDS4049064.1 glycogen/starch/alpha-glucan phosphorylase [Accumulibacter sp.]